jgi:predicted LPLAT superfamily acyltransferase
VSSGETPQSAARWSSRSVGADWQHRFFYLLIRRGGRRIAYGFLRLVVLYYTLLRPDQRRKGLHYLRRRFPAARGLELLRHSYRHSLSLGQVLIDRAVVGILGPGELAVSFPAGARLQELLEQGRGLILMTAHVGCWQVAMAALDALETPVNLLMRREAGDVDRLVFEHRGGPSPFRIIDPEGEFGGALEMVAALKRGEVLSVMGDRLLGSDRNGLGVEFLGGPVTFPFSAYKLASATGAPVAVLLSRKVGPAAYALELARVIEVPPGLGRGGEVFRPYVAEVAAALEGYVEQNPYQFFNFFDLWDMAPPGA